MASAATHRRDEVEKKGIGWCDVGLRAERRINWTGGGRIARGMEVMQGES